jgi:enoyl-CoA hydratase/carnithine racemase
MSETPFVEYRTEGAVALIHINRPDVLNAFSREVYRGVNDAIKRFNDDESVRVAVLSTAGRSFSGGVDLKDLRLAMDEAGVDNPSTLAPQFSLDHEDLAFSEKPIIAAIQGQCYGQGMTLAMACDLRVAADDARFCLPEVKIGIASVHGTLRCVHNAGLGNALELLLLGEPRSAQWAQRVGLVNELVPEQQVHSRAMELAQTIAAMDPKAIYATRKVAYFAQYHDFEETVELGAQQRQQMWNAEK